MSAAAALKYDSATCPNCQAIFDALPVDRGEDGYATVSIPTKKCDCPTCEVMLCSNCPQFHCECGRTYCAEDMGNPDSPETSTHEIRFRGMRMCSECAVETLEANEPECTCGDWRGCEKHDSNSTWNAARRQITTLQEYEQYKKVA